MLNIADTLHRWCREARPFALATVVGVHGSAPLPVGTSVAVDEDGDAVGSISGGCVEGAVYELCRQMVRDLGTPRRARFGYSDDDAFAVGLTCGGELDVFVQRIDPAAHDAKFDIPLLRLALDLPVAYVGAMGSRRTHDERMRRLREEGVTGDRLARLRSPIGLDLGASTPEETAVSITAEIIAHAHHGTGRPLTRTTGPIHRPPEPASRR
ncbi:XdhC family protein [Streptomyces sp. IBSBF 2806]|uniref:XdhC family protein n=1 Tax=Streptomyces sp. IBSBF 2806 TaxID=2903529 RepID=UPI002FDC7A24